MVSRGPAGAVEQQQAAFGLTRERHDRHVLYVHGTVEPDGIALIEHAAVAALADPSGGLVLDLSEVPAVTRPLLDVLGSVARRGAALRNTVTVRLPEGHLDDLPPMDDVRVERTRAVPVAAAPRPAPTAPSASAAPTAPGTGRREGPGQVTSFGVGRSCAVAGCSTELSRYNSRATCSVHSPRH
jgi:hypothetical protein